MALSLSHLSSLYLSLSVCLSLFSLYLWLFFSFIFHYLTFSQLSRNVYFCQIFCIFCLSIALSLCFRHRMSFLIYLLRLYVHNFFQVELTFLCFVTFFTFLCSPVHSFIRSCFKLIRNDGKCESSGRPPVLPLYLKLHLYVYLST
jgi:hypothetical protein